MFVSTLQFSKWYCFCFRFPQAVKLRVSPLVCCSSSSFFVQAPLCWTIWIIVPQEFKPVLSSLPGLHVVMSLSPFVCCLSLRAAWMLLFQVSMVQRRSCGNRSPWRHLNALSVLLDRHSSHIFYNLLGFFFHHIRWFCCSVQMKSIAYLPMPGEGCLLCGQGELRGVFRHSFSLLESRI